jgi:hypothetical protein
MKYKSGQNFPRTSLLSLPALLLMIWLHGCDSGSRGSNREITPTVDFPTTDTTVVATDPVNTTITAHTGTWILQNPGVRFRVRDIIYNGSEYLVVGNELTGITTLKSKDLTHWVEHTDHTYYLFNPKGLMDVIWTGRSYIARANNGEVFSSPTGESWTRLSGVGDIFGKVLSLAWSGELIVAVGEAGKTITSADGEEWTVQPAVTEQNLRHVEWVNNQFIALGTNGAILFSNDGVQWRVEKLTTDKSLREVAWNGDIYVVVSEGGYFVSNDGLTWSDENLSNSQITDIAWSDTLRLFVAVSDRRGIATSPDAENWTTQIDPLEAPPLLRVIWDGSQFIAGGSTGEILTSADGINWRIRTSGADLNNVIWTGSHFYAVGEGLVLSSENGTEWTYHRTPERDDTLYDIADSGSMILTAAGRTLNMADRELNWTYRRGIGAVSADYSVIWDERQFVSVGTTSSVRLSADGIDYSYVRGIDIDHNRSLRDITFTGVDYLATGTQGTIITSRDAVNWTVANSNTSKTLNGTAWSGDAFVAVGADGTVLYSEDGMDWIPQQSNASGSLNDIIWANGEFVAIGENTRILLSKNGRHWTALGFEEGFGHSYNGIASSQDRLVIVGDNGTIIVREHH